MALLLCLLLSGCGTMRLASILDQDEDALSDRFPYSSVAGDILVAGVTLTEAPPLVLFIFADLPVAAVVDTLCLPFDLVSTIKEVEKKRAAKKRRESVKNYPAGSTPSTGPTPSLDETGSGNGGSQGTDSVP
jgi:uncharacterized protein YceK